MVETLIPQIQIYMCICCTTYSQNTWHHILFYIIKQIQKPTRKSGGGKQTKQSD